MRKLVLKKYGVAYNDDECDKCGTPTTMWGAHKITYDKEKDLMIVACCRCGYEWNIPPKDKKDD